jgi:hypothetical protein
VKREWLVLGLLLMLIGLLVFSFANTSVSGDSYVLKGSVDNSNNYSLGNPTEVNVTGYFETGQRFFFNFTKGRFWGVKYDTDNGLEPADTNFSPNSSIIAHKIVTFYIYTPSGDAIYTDVYVLGATEPFAVYYGGQSPDFIPLEDGNLSTINVGIEGTIGRTGYYTVQAYGILPPVMQSAQLQYSISEDPPLLMRLWSIEKVETVPYFVSSVSVGTILVLFGVVSIVWAARSRGRPRHWKKNVVQR